MRKNEFLLSVVGSFLTAHPKWILANVEKRQHSIYVARDLGPVFVHLGFTARPDRELFGQSVGWAPSRERFLASLHRRTNPPIRLRDGQLARLRHLDKPRDFEHEELSFPTAALIRPITGFRLSEMSLDAIREQMLLEIDQYALPYLCMMLKFRHGIEVTPQQLAREEIPSFC